MVLIALIDQSLFRLTERLEVLEGINVILHLVLRAHAGEYCHHAGKGTDEAQGPGSDGGIGARGLKPFLKVGAHAGERTAFYGLHDDHGDILMKYYWTLVKAKKRLFSS